MPGLNGIQTWHELRAINPQVKITLMSGFNATDITSCFDQAIHFLQKPFSAEMLMNALYQ